MSELPVRHYAYLGDAVWELFVREHTVYVSNNTKTLHSLTTERVKTEAQMIMLLKINDLLTDEEKELIRRARNANIPVARRNMQQEYRQATAFETLIGYWYLNDKERLEYFYEIFIQNNFYIS